MGAGKLCSFAGLLHVPRREAVTLVVNSLFWAELSAGADLSHAQLGVGGREAAGTLEPLFQVLSLGVFSGLKEERTTFCVPGQSSTDFEDSRAELDLCRRHFWDTGIRSAAPQQVAFGECQLWFILTPG